MIEKWIFQLKFRKFYVTSMGSVHSPHIKWAPRKCRTHSHVREMGSAFSSDIEIPLKSTATSQSSILSNHARTHRSQMKQKFNIQKQTEKNPNQFITFTELFCNNNSYKIIHNNFNAWFYGISTMMLIVLGYSFQRIHFIGIIIIFIKISVWFAHKQKF